ncbi:hypothetical protein [Actinoplanes sp. L3-i22]|uniref:hypothetical protein n=1 Tax=Actinoplanes sp. L3-i22 TaxID=2836373 RepID=UPI001C796F0F|nr:hypothetical protein [Actinoplanes sp. L3-i22]BCY15381.1 hypothetical protein L3i22_104690 [Actinoplanes sp. L3-i22]
MRLDVETSAASRVDGQTASLQGTVWTAAGDPVCPIRYTGGTCTLTGDGTHTFFRTDDNGSPLDYPLRLVRTDRPTGCETLAQGGFGKLSDAQIADVTLDSYAYTCRAEGHQGVKGQRHGPGRPQGHGVDRHVDAAAGRLPVPVAAERQGDQGRDRVLADDQALTDGEGRPDRAGPRLHCFRAGAYEIRRGRTQGRPLVTGRGWGRTAKGF